MFKETLNSNTFLVLLEDFSLMCKNKKRGEYNLDFYSLLLREMNDTFKFIWFIVNNYYKYILNEDEDGEDKDSKSIS
jgi:hypothetical protein